MNNWKYKLKIQDRENNEILIETPVRLEATISFGVNGQSQRGEFTLYNLSAKHRAELRFNPSIVALNLKRFVDVSAKIEFYVAQDGQSYTKIFEGALDEAYSQEIGGQVGIATYISARMIYTQLALCSHIFAKGTSKREAIKTIIKDIPNVTLGNLGSIEGNFLTDTTCDGNAFEQIQKITGSNAFVDNGEINIVPSNESIDGYIEKIHNDTALLGTPMMKGAYITFKCMFIPELKYRQYLDIDSHIYSDFSGSYQVVGYTHTLVFSETEGGTKTTDVHCCLVSETPSQDIVTTLGTSKTDANYQTLTTTQSNNKVKGEEVTAVDAQISGDIKSIRSELIKNGGKLTQKIRSTKITPNISWGEMLGFHRNTDADRAKITLRELANCVAIAKKLQKFHDAYFPAQRLTINCGWRSSSANKSTPGAANKSYHLQGMAIDFNFDTFPLTREIYYKYFYKTAYARWDGGYGLGKPCYIHLDCRGKREMVYEN